MGHSAAHGAQLRRQRGRRAQRGGPSGAEHPGVCGGQERLGSQGFMAKMWVFKPKNGFQRLKNDGLKFSNMFFNVLHGFGLRNLK